MRCQRTIRLVPNTRAISNVSYSDYLSNLGDDLKTKTTELSQKQLQSLVETGTCQALKALGIIEKQVNELTTDSVTTSVTFNAGILQVTFSTTGMKSTVKKD